MLLALTLRLLAAEEVEERVLLSTKSVAEEAEAVSALCLRTFLFLPTQLTRQWLDLAEPEMVGIRLSLGLPRMAGLLDQFPPVA